VLHGGYGKRNLGDEAILYVLLDQLRRVFPDGRIIVLGHGPKEIERDHGVEAGYFLSRRALEAIWRADLYIIGGGGIINRINSYSGWRRLRILDPKGKFLFLAALLAQARGAKVIFHAIGATSLPDPLVGWLARAAMNRADEVSVRDPLSRRLLYGWGVKRDIHVIPDPAMQLEAAAPAAAQEILRREGIEPEGRLVGLSFRAVAEPDIGNAATARAVAQVADWLSEEYAAQVCFLPFGRHPTKPVENDLFFAQEVAEQVQHSERFHILRHLATPPEMKALLAEMDFCLLERLHATILAAGVAVPFLAVSYEDKVAEFMRAIGRGERIIELRQFDFETAQQKLRVWIPWR
jgi:polysaccharide pyruvyl transferase CsaB